MALAYTTVFKRAMRVSFETYKTKVEEQQEEEDVTKNANKEQFV